MAEHSSIEWTNATWNPVTGCTRVSPGCANCYASRMAHRLRAMGQHRYRHGFQVTLQPDLLSLPLAWKKPKYVFVNSMSDLFHDEVPTEYIVEVFNVMTQAKWHTFQVLTKRSQRLSALCHKLNWSPNVWIGVSIEDSSFKYRVDHLRHIPAAVRYLSIEPLLGPISKLSLKGIDWVIVGGESGPKAREMKAEWVRPIRDKCVAMRIPFFFKQWGGPRKTKTGRHLDEKTWDEFPQPKDGRFV